MLYGNKISILGNSKLILMTTSLGPVVVIVTMVHCSPPYTPVCSVYNVAISGSTLYGLINTADSRYFELAYLE